MVKHKDNRLWFIILSVSLLLNAYFLFYKNKDKADQILASAGDQTFRWKDVSERGQQGFKQLDRSYYLLMRSEAERWAESRVLPKEAGVKGVAVDALLKAEVFDKVQVSPEETQARYAHSPTADKIPWPQVLKQIEAELKNNRYQERKREYLKELFTRYGVHFDLVVPKSFDDKEPLQSTRFPLYEPPPLSLEVDPGKGVLRAPSLGPADAPIVIELYSDFHCPFCKKFSGTLKELEQQYPGKLRLVFHHFPLPMHKGADVSHQASVCAQEQGKFWEYHDKLMALTVKPEKETYSSLAAEVGADPAAFQACFDSGKYKAWVEQEAKRGTAIGVAGAPGYLINGRLLKGAGPIEALKKIIDWNLKPVGQYPGPVESAQPGGAGGPQPQQRNPGLDPQKKYEFPTEWLKKGASKGSANAPVTIVEFLDYNCPFCKNGAALTDQVLAAYPGKVRVLAKNLPLPMHPNAQKTAEAVLCAQEQGKFWEFRKEVFGEFWGKNSVEDMKAIAKKMGLKEADFTACLDTSKTKPSIDEDVKVIQSLGSTGTPTFFVNGKPVVGAMPFESFRKVIDEALAEKK